MRSFKIEKRQQPVPVEGRKIHLLQTPIRFGMERFVSGLPCVTHNPSISPCNFKYPPPHIFQPTAMTSYQCYACLVSHGLSNLCGNPGFLQTTPQVNILSVFTFIRRLRSIVRWIKGPMLTICLVPRLLVKMQRNPRLFG